MTDRYKDNLVALSKILNNMDALLGFDQKMWNSCIGHIAGLHGIGGLTVNDRGWPVYDHPDCTGPESSLKHVFGAEIAKVIFENEHYYKYSFNGMVEVVNNYLMNVYGVPVPKKVVTITLDASDINRLYKMLFDAEEAGKTFDTLVINSNGDYTLSFGASVISTR